MIEESNGPMMIPISSLKDLEASSLPMQGGLDPHRSDEEDASAGKDSSLANPISRYTWDPSKKADDGAGELAGAAGSVPVKTVAAAANMMIHEDDGILEDEEGREFGHMISKGDPKSKEAEVDVTNAADHSDEDVWSRQSEVDLLQKIQERA